MAITDYNQRVFLLEEEMEANKNDRREYQILTVQQWYFCLQYARSGGIASVKDFAETIEVDRTQVHHNLKSKRVRDALTSLMGIRNHHRMVRVEDRLFEIAEEGSPRDAIAAAKLLDSRYPREQILLDQEEEEETFVLSHDWKTGELKELTKHGDIAKPC